MNGVHAFTGHRPPRLGGYSLAARQRLVSFAMGVLGEARTEIAIVGMAQGWDQAVAQAAVNLDVPFIAAVPFRGQESVWPTEAQERYRILLAAAQDVHFITDEEPATRNRASGYLAQRNRWMVDNATHLHALWDGNPVGGTADCIRYAKGPETPWTNHWDQWTLSTMFEDILG